MNILFIIWKKCIEYLFEIIQFLPCISYFQKDKTEPKVEVVVIDPMIEYIEKKKSWFLKKYELKYTPLKISNRTAVETSTKLPVTDLKQAPFQGADSNLHRYNQILNSNIDPLFYHKTNFINTLKDEKNMMEKKWRTNILYEPTPRGNVIMYYDVYKYAFTYYSDQYSIPYSVLNAIAMKYCVTFCCRDFFMDENTLEGTEMKTSPLIKIFFEDEKKEEVTDKKKIDTKEMLKNAPLAKLKNYKMTTITNENKSTSLSPPVLFKNKFIYLGKIMNYFILQKQQVINKDKSSLFSNTSSSKYRDLFSETNINANESSTATATTNVHTNIKTKKLSWKDYKNMHMNKNIDIDTDIELCQ
jgi:hypothetical protein